MKAAGDGEWDVRRVDVGSDTGELGDPVLTLRLRWEENNAPVVGATELCIVPRNRTVVEGRMLQSVNASMGSCRECENDWTGDLE